MMRDETIFVGWHDAGGRATALADKLGVEIFNFATSGKGRAWRAPDRYARTAGRTLRLLRTRKPGTVLVTNPPIFAALVVHLYQSVFGGRLIVDSHTGAFLDPRWRRFIRLHRWISRRAHLTIVHNSHQAAIVEEWGVSWVQLGYVPIDQPAAGAGEGPSGPYVLAICSGGYDEPLDAIADAARALPSIPILVTGRADRIAARLSQTPPPNLEILGFLEFSDYLTRVAGAAAVLALTTREATLVNGGFEAIAAGRPLITSATGVLEDYFHLGTIHTANTGDDIAAAITECLARSGDLQVGMKALADEYGQAWDEVAPQLLDPGRGVR